AKPRPDVAVEVGSLMAVHDVHDARPRQVECADDPGVVESAAQDEGHLGTVSARLHLREGPRPFDHQRVLGGLMTVVVTYALAVRPNRFDDRPDVAWPAGQPGREVGRRHAGVRLVPTTERPAALGAGPRHGRARLTCPWSRRCTPGAGRRARCAARTPR